MSNNSSVGSENVNNFNPNNYNFNNAGNNNAHSASTASNAPPHSQWVSIDVIGDGNCFYRSLYYAALFSPDPNAFKRLLLCFCLNVDDYKDDLENYKEVVTEYYVALEKHEEAAAAGKRAKAPAAPPSEMEHEHQFCSDVRAALANEIKYKDLFKRMDNSGLEDYKSPYAILREKADLGPELWAAVVDEFSHTFKRKFRRVATFTAMSEEDFKETYADIVKADREFVGQLEILMLNFILRHCGLKIHVLDPHGAATVADINNANNVLSNNNNLNANHNANGLEAAAAARPNNNMSIKHDDTIRLAPLFVMRMPEHYHVVIPGDTYTENFMIFDNVGNGSPTPYSDVAIFKNYERVRAYMAKRMAGGRRRRLTRKRLRRRATRRRR